MTRHCKSCASWTRQTTTAGKCDDPHFVYNNGLRETGSGEVQYWDADSYAAGIEMGENFGCIYHKVSRLK